MRKIIALFVLLTITLQLSWATESLNTSNSLQQSSGSFSDQANILFQVETADPEDEEELLLEEDYEWGFWDSYPRLYLVPFSLVGFYIGVEQIKRQFALGNRADEAEERGDSEEEQKLRDQATIHEVFAVISLVTATLMFSYGIKKKYPDIFDSMIIDRQKERAYLGLRRTF